MTYQPPFQLQYLLSQTSRDAYNDQDVIERGIVNDADLSQGETLSILIAQGHLDLAKAMVASGVAPERSIIVGARQYFDPRDKERYSLLDMILSASRYKDYDHTTQLKHSTWEVLDYVLSHADVWPTGLNENEADQRYRPYHTVLTGLHPSYNADEAACRRRLIKLLVDAGADINLNSDRRNMMFSAFDSYTHRDKKDTRAEIQYLLDMGFDKDKDSHLSFYCALHADIYPDVAPYNRQKELGPNTKLLLDLGFKMSAPTNCPDEVNPFWIAIVNGQHVVMQHLLDAGLDPAYIDPERGETIFSAAAKSKKQSSIQTLLMVPDEKLVSVANHPNQHGDTPLHHAVAALSLPLIKKLLACGANLNAVNHKGQLPLQTVKRTNPKSKQQFDEIIEFLDSQAGAALSAHQMPDILHKACASLAPDLVQKMIDQGANVNGLNRQGQTPLMVLAKNSKTYKDNSLKQEAKDSYAALIGILMDAGADINARDKKGNTALHFAVEKVSPVMVETLINAGANPNILNNKKLNPSHTWNDQWQGWADQQKDAPEIIEIILASDFNPTVKGPKGEPPFKFFHETPAFLAAVEKWELTQNTASTRAGHARRARL